MYRSLYNAIAFDLFVDNNEQEINDYLENINNSNIFLNLLSNIISYFSEYNETTKRQIKYLYDNHYIDFILSDNKIEIAVPCNDVFAHACADLEIIKLNEIEGLYSTCYSHGYYGSIAFVSYKRNTKPLNYIIEEKQYQEAIKIYSNLKKKDLT